MFTASIADTMNYYFHLDFRHVQQSAINKTYRHIEFNARDSDNEMNQLKQ